MSFVSFSSENRIRLARVIALSGVIAIAACQDATAPDEIAPAEAPAALSLTQNSADELSSLSSNLDDMTGWSLAGFADARGKQNIIGVLNGLKGHLASGKIDACQQDVDAARDWFSKLSENDQTELGGIGVTLDLIQQALNKASQ
jgi:hypothetical protein